MHLVDNHYFSKLVVFHIFDLHFYISQSYKANVLADWIQHSQIGSFASTFTNSHLTWLMLTIMGPFNTWDQWFINHICLQYYFTCSNSSSIWYFHSKKSYKYSFLLKTPCIWYLGQIKYLVSISGWKSHILIFYYLHVFGWWNSISTLHQFVSLWVLQRRCTFSVISEAVCSKLLQMVLQVYFLSWRWYSVWHLLSDIVIFQNCQKWFYEIIINWL